MGATVYGGNDQYCEKWEDSVERSDRYNVLRACCHVCQEEVHSK